ncbi:sel1 repeat family protein [Helicobacter suis]|uniref:sel1 repeat family protein n=1 Tax=Helicobacter suis TaxID=104628 RepID=UPI0013D58AB9|nr:sel1 repeat family protein [Helicobacter suis]
MSKQHSGSFLLERGLLELLDFIAAIECQSRAVIIERILKYYLMQQRNTHGNYPNKKKYWKKSRCGVYKVPQKVFSRYGHSSPFNGQGVEQDYQKALKYYKKATEGGDAEGYNGLGFMYYAGRV